MSKSSKCEKAGREVQGTGLFQIVLRQGDSGDKLVMFISPDFSAKHAKQTCCERLLLDRLKDCLRNFQYPLMDMQQNLAIHPWVGPRKTNYT